MTERQIGIASCVLADAEISAALAVLKSGNLTQGPAVEAFEREFARRMDVPFAVACSSGTAALHLVYGLLLRPGDEVLVPAMTFLATASMVSAVGCVPVFCDVDPQTWLIDLADAARKVTARTRAIVPVHLFGNPCDPAAVEAFAGQHGLIVIGDAAQAHGARFAGHGIGALGTASIFSLYATKNLFVGEGGAICCSDAAMVAELRSRRSHGLDADGLVRQLGYNYRLPQVHAALGTAQLQRFDAMLASRRRNATRLMEELGALPGLAFQRTLPGSEHAFHQCCVVVDEREFGLNRDRLADDLRGQGIGTAVHYRIPPHRQPVFSGQGAMAPTADAVCARILALPVHHDLSADDVTAIVAAVRACHRTAVKRPRSA